MKYFWRAWWCVLCVLLVAAFPLLFWHPEFYIGFNWLVNEYERIWGE